MLTKEENDLLTQTDAGTPGGILLRSFWQPAALSEELPFDSAPIRIRIFGEDLVLFRDDAGSPGLLGLHCPHRAADLSYGRCEDGGLRCLYHGWLFDAAGNCTEQPGEPAESDFKTKVKQTAYPCKEQAGLIFTYMGQGEPPLLPAYPALQAGDGQWFVTKFFQECNYLQGNEGNLDPEHLSFLHRAFINDPRANADLVKGGEASFDMLLGKDKAPVIEIEETNYGLRIFTTRNAEEGETFLRLTNYVFPNMNAFPGGVGGTPADQGHGMHWHVPIDDTHHWKYQLTTVWAGSLDKTKLNAGNGGDLKPDYHLHRNTENRFLQNRGEMKDTTFAGMGFNIQVHDVWATAGEGPIQDRTTEHLGYTDKVITAARRQLLDAVRTVQEGGEPKYVARDAGSNSFGHMVSFNEVGPKSTDWHSLWQERIPK